jgi:hypothetical protein
MGIIAIVGGIGSGKTCSMTRKILHSKYPVYCNYKIRGGKTLKGDWVRRLRYDMIVNTDTEVSPRGKETTKMSVNWDYWNEVRETCNGFSIVVDEIHNIAHNRMTGNKFNIHFSLWLSQVRKILSDSEKTHLYCITQSLYHIDKRIRDLMHGVILCNKMKDTSTLIKTRVWDRHKKKFIYKMLPKVYIQQYYFFGREAESQFLAYSINGEDTATCKTWFLANPYFQYYDTHYKLGESVYL